MLIAASRLKNCFMAILFVLPRWLSGGFKNVVLYFNNYFTKVGTLFYIVHCFIFNGNFQGYLVKIRFETVEREEKLQLCGEKGSLEALRRGFKGEIFVI